MYCENPLFIPHGHCSFEYRDRIVLCKVSGAWNAQQARLFRQQVQLLARSFAGTARVRVMDMSEWELSCPDVAAEISQLRQWEEKNGCVARFFCQTSALHRDLLQRKYRAGAPLLYADTVEEGIQRAQSWLNLLVNWR